MTWAPRCSFPTPTPKQDILLEEEIGPELVAELGLDPRSTRALVLTEVFERPEPERVDIGFHLIAVDTATGLPLDFDGDGLPDYVEDRNGNGGNPDSGETAWQVSENGTTGAPGLQVFNPSGPDVRLGLGADDFEKDAGFLNIRATVPSVDLGKSAGLSVPLEGDNVQVLAPSGTITQVKSPQGLVNVAVETASKYHLLVYHPANVTTNGSSYSTNGNPFVVYTVSYVSAAVPLKVKEWRDGVGAVREHQFAHHSQNSHWTLTDDQSTRATESWTEGNLGQNPNRSQYHHEVKVGGQTVRAVARTYEKTWWWTT